MTIRVLTMWLAVATLCVACPDFREEYGMLFFVICTIFGGAFVVVDSME